MLFSVVIPTCRRYPVLRECLEALRPERQNFGRGDYETIVSDDTPPDQRQPDPAPDLKGVTAVEGPRRGPACNRNRGANVARGDWLVFIDDDCIPEPGFLQAYQAAISVQPDCNVFEGRTVADRPQQRMDEEAPITETGGYLWSCNFAIRRQLFDRLHGFCEDFPFATLEDVDLRLRILAAGEKFLFVPEARVVHPWRAVSTATTLVRMHLVSHRVFYARHPGQRPSFLGQLSIILRDHWRQLAREGPRYQYRGVWRWFVNRSMFTVAELQLALDSLTARRS
jgi:GT2 family glycosyltransferase